MSHHDEDYATVDLTEQALASEARVIHRLRQELAREQQEHDRATTRHATAVKERDAALAEIEVLTGRLAEVDYLRHKLDGALALLRECDPWLLSEAIHLTQGGMPSDEVQALRARLDALLGGQGRDR